MPWYQAALMVLAMHFGMHYWKLGRKEFPQDKPQSS